MQFDISQRSRERLGTRLVVASTSGGKDSTALALTLMEHEIPHVRVFADTGFEAPETYEYLDLLRSRLGPIEVVRNESLWQDALPGEEGMLTLIRRKKMFPSRLMRFCTQKLKVFPIRDYLRALQDRGEDVVSAVGVRADESAARAQMSEWEFWDEIDAEVWRPILRWTEQDVIDMHKRHGIPPNPLYLGGARRVGCLPCIHARKRDIRLIPAEQLAKIRRVEEELTADAVARGCDRPTRAFFQVRGPEGLRFTPIDEVVRLAHLHRGRPVEVGREPPGCVRWGMCESAGEGDGVPGPAEPPAAPVQAPPAELPAAPAQADPQAPSADLPAAPAAATDPPRWIGHDHMRSLGITDEKIRGWLTCGDLTSPHGDGFYLRTPAFDAAFARLTARRVIGRGHLISLGATQSMIARWLRHGTLRRTAERGFYELTIAAYESLRPPPQPADRDAEAVVVPPPPSASAPASEALRLRVVPCTITRGRAFIAEHHRHLEPPVSGLFAVGLARGDQLVGVAMVGRPVARALQDGSTAEVTRICTLGDRNACSMLLAACRRGAAALGYRRVVTYTLASEPGTSLRAAGWREVGRVRGRSWSCAARPRGSRPVHDKRRWEAPALHPPRPATPHKEHRHVDA